MELIGESITELDPEVVRQAAMGVLHYFREELGRESVTVVEFSEALARVLRGFGLEVASAESQTIDNVVRDADLHRLASEAGGGLELVFFSRLRAELEAGLREAPTILRFNGLRPCVKELVGTRRWSPKCQRLSDQIVDYLRRCLSEAAPRGDCALVVR